jgi:hypothetical protein
MMMNPNALPVVTGNHVRMLHGGQRALVGCPRAAAAVRAALDAPGLAAILVTHPRAGHLGGGGPPARPLAARDWKTRHR